VVWAGKVAVSCTIDSARMLHKKYLCSRHFLESDFTTAERVQLNRVAVPCGSDSASQSLPQCPVSSLYTPSLNPLPSVITHKVDISVLLPTRSYSKTLMLSTVTPFPIRADSLFTSLQMSAVQSSPTAASTIAVNEPSFPLSSVNANASDAELGHTSRHSSSSKPTTRHFLIKELNLASLPELTPRKRKLYEHIQNKESALCKVKKKYKGKKLRKLCDVDSYPLMDNLSSVFRVIKKV
jgi:ABC-type uncharacterized transport system permease subunit